MHKRKFASNIVLFLFFILVSVAALFSDIFQNPIKTATEAIEQSKLFVGADLTLIKRISLKNKSGEYIFERKEISPTSPWHMVVPREVSSNSLFIENFFNALNTVKVKKIFPDETINNSNFSIDKPTAFINLTDEAGNAITINVGLMNTIDNSTYLKIVGKKGIFHVDAPSVSLENVTILDLIESQIFPIDIGTVTAFKISRNKKAFLEIKKTEGAWQDHEGNPLAVEKIADYFQDLSVLKSAFTLDKQTENQKKQISLFSKNPEYTISITNAQNVITEYNISPLVKSVSDLDLKNEEHFVVTQSSNQTAYIVKKEFLELFSRKIETLKNIVIPN